MWTTEKDEHELEAGLGLSPFRYVQENASLTRRVLKGRVAGDKGNVMTCQFPAINFISNWCIAICDHGSCLEVLKCRR